MKNTLEKIITLGLGTIAVTREKADEVVKELMKEGQISRKDADLMVKNLMKKGEASKKELHVTVENTIHAVMKKLDVPTRSEMNKLRAEIAQLKKAKQAKRK